MSRQLFVVKDDDDRYLAFDRLGEDRWVKDIVDAKIMDEGLATSRASYYGGRVHHVVLIEAREPEDI